MLKLNANKGTVKQAPKTTAKTGATERIYTANDVQKDITGMETDLLLGAQEMHDSLRDVAAALEFTVAIEQFGLSSDMLDLATRTGLMSSAATVSLEAFNDNQISLEQATIVAMEGVIDTVKEKIAKWVSKVWDFLKSIGSRFTSACTKAASWIGSMSTKVKDKTVEFKNKAVETVKLHPYATAAAAVGLLAAAGGAFALISRGIAKPEGMAKAAEDVADMAKKFTSGVGVDDKVIDGTYTVISVKDPPKFNFKSSGWDATKFKDILNKAREALSKLRGSIGTLFSGIVASVKTWPSKILTGVGKYADFATSGVRMDTHLGVNMIKAAATKAGDFIRQKIIPRLPEIMRNNSAFMKGAGAVGGVAVVYAIAKWTTTIIEGAFRTFVILPIKIVKWCLTSLYRLAFGRGSESEEQPA